MGDIGIERREVELEPMPLEEPISVPSEVPAEPVKEPA